MKLQPNPFYRRVRLIVREHPLESWSGVVFRSVPLEFAKPQQIVDGLGAMKSGGRWNPPGSIRVLYCSLNPGKAAEESMRLFEAAGLKRATVNPRLIVGIRFRLAAIVDLADLVNSIHGADLADLMAEEWRKINAQGRETMGQALGRALFRSGVEAFRVPSALMPDAINLVIFPGILRPTSRQRVLEENNAKAWNTMRYP